MSFIYRFNGLVHDIVRHLRVNFARQFNESRVDLKFTSLPRKVERIDRYAMPAETGARVKRHKPERLCLGSFNYLPYVYSHSLINNFQLVHKRNIHGPEDI